MEKSAEKPLPKAFDEILMLKPGESFSESQQKTLDAMIRARIKDQIKGRLEQFASRVIKPQAELTKALKNAAEKDPRQKARQFRRVESPNRMVPSPIPAPNTLPIPPYVWGAHYSPPYDYSSPIPELDVPAAPGIGLSDKIEYASQDGSISIGGAVGGGGALGFGVVLDLGASDRWLFGDASIALAGYTQFANFPPATAHRTMNVSADIVVGSGTPGEPEGTWLNGVPEWGFWTGVNGWVGVVGDIFLLSWSVIPGGVVPQPLWQRFVYNWASGNFGGDNFYNYFQPQLSIFGSFDVAPTAGRQLINVGAWAAALRMTSLDGYETDGASFQFLDPVSVKGTIAGAGGPGPIKVTGIDVFVGSGL